LWIASINGIPFNHQSVLLLHGVELAGEIDCAILCTDAV
jgi:hypothetical protein